MLAKQKACCYNNPQTQIEIAIRAIISSSQEIIGTNMVERERKGGKALDHQYRSMISSVTSSDPTSTI